MTQINFGRLDELFNQALTLPPEQWPSFVSKACGDDASSAQRLLAMLQADHGADTEADPVGDVIANQRQHLNQHDQHQQPIQIGPYDVVRTLGHGGMGSVYLAERQQRRFVQQVAIKLLRARTASESLRSRFRQEQQVLASLPHAAIAGLVDAGETDSGQPYVVMEYVEGQTLTDYAEQHQLDAKARIKLFVQLCGAVSYAHRNLIVHRDLKPDNVLVDANGMVKLLDFGIAKLLPADGRTEQLGTFTRAGAMTPPYASPEQVRGESISTQSDIYSLGVVLYELLAGQLPYVIDAHSSALELERQICDTDPVPPSKRTSERTSGLADALVPAKRLRGDLDNIVLKAMRKEPQRRYDSVAQLADDLQRHLDDLPVSARADSLAYRTQKLIARNPLAVAASAVLAVSLIGFGAISRQHATQLAQQRDRANQEAQAAIQVADFMIDLFQVSDHRATGNAELTARNLLDRAAESIDQQVSDAPLQRARLLHTLGLAYGNLGHYQRGLKLLNGALEVRRTEFGPVSVEVAESLNQIGNHHRHYGRLIEAEEALKTALQVQQRVSDGVTFELADSYNNFGLFQREIGQHQPAIETLQRSIAMHRELAGADNQYVAYALHNLSQAYQELGEYRRALELIDESLDIKRRIGFENRSTYANSLAVRGSIQRARGNFPDALISREQSLALRRRVFTDAHPNLVAGMIGLASLKIDLGQLDEAKELLEEALPVAIETGGERSNIVARVLTVTGRLRLQTGQYADAVDLMSEVLSIRRQNMRSDNPDLWSSQHELGVAQLAAGNLTAADNALVDALELRTARFAAGHPDVAATRVALAQLKLEQGQFDEAAALAEVVIATSPTTTERSFLFEREQAAAHRLVAKVFASNQALAVHHRTQATKIEARYPVTWR